MIDWMSLHQEITIDFISFNNGDDERINFVSILHWESTGSSFI